VEHIDSLAELGPVAIAACAARELLIARLTRRPGGARTALGTAGADPDPGRVVPSA